MAGSEGSRPRDRFSMAPGHRRQLVALACAGRVALGRRREAVHARLDASSRPVSRLAPGRPGAAGSSRRRRARRANSSGTSLSGRALQPAAAQRAYSGGDPLSGAQAARAEAKAAAKAAARAAAARQPLPPELPRAPTASAGPPAPSLVCAHRAQAGFEGTAFTWGMAFHTPTAADCCEACQAHARLCASPGAAGATFWRAPSGGVVGRCGRRGLGCNVFVHCPSPLCWANDVHNHSFGECWLKHQPDPSRPRAPALGAYPPEYRRKHRTAPERVQWTSGALVPPGTRLAVDGPHWRWRR